MRQMAVACDRFLVSFAEPFERKLKEAASAGGSSRRSWGKYHRLQLLTVAELLDGRSIEYPHVTGGNKTFREAPRAKHAVAKAPTLFDEELGARRRATQRASQLWQYDDVILRGP